MKNKDKIRMDEIEIVHINKSHKSLIENFQTYEKDLADFLQEDALDNHLRNISTTYLWFHKKTNELLGYLTLSTDSIRLTEPLRKEFTSKNINYKSLPALKIGRVCVDDRFRGKNIGKFMMFYTFKLVATINEQVGCRFVTLDAKRNKENSKDSIHFYKKMGFNILRDRQKGTTPMYKDMIRIIKAIKEEIKSNKNN